MCRYVLLLDYSVVRCVKSLCYSKKCESTVFERWRRFSKREKLGIECVGGGVTCCAHFHVYFTYTNEKDIDCKNTISAHFVSFLVKKFDSLYFSPRFGAETYQWQNQ